MKTGRLKKFVGDKAFYKMALAIIIPVIIQQIILSIAGYVDSLMINSYSQVAYVGVSTSNRFMFVINFFWIGLASGISIFVAQYRGAKQTENIKAIIQLSLIIAIIIGIISFFAIYFLGPLVLKAFIPGQGATDLESVRFGTEYIKMIAFGAVIMLLNFMVSTIFRSLGKPKIPMFAGIAGIAINILLNVLLIFGYLGFPELGAMGAAIATVASKVIELGILLVVAFFFSEEGYARKIWKKVYLNSRHVIMYLRKGTPIVINEVMWAIGMQLLAFFITGGNTAWLTSYNYFQNITDLFFVYYAGIATGTAVLVGSALGEGAFEKAKDYANKLIGLMVVAGTVAIILLVSVSPALLLILTPVGEIYWNAYYLILVTSAFIILYGFNAMVYYILRAGGDSLRSVLLDQLPIYLIGIPLAFLLYKMEPKWQLGLVLIFLITRLIDVIKVIASYFVFKQETWLQNLTVEEPSKPKELKSAES